MVNFATSDDEYNLGHVNKGCGRLKKKEKRKGRSSCAWGNFCIELGSNKVSKI